MQILVIGANGYVGARLYQDLKKEFGDVIGTFNSHQLFKELIHLDVTKPAQVDAVVIQTKPEVIVNVVSNPSSAWCAEHPAEAEALNVGGAKNVLTAANRVNAKLVYISSRSALHPNDVYGKTKLEAQEISKGAKAGWLIIQPGHVIGLSPNVDNERFFNNTMKDFRDKGETVADNSGALAPTWIGHISEVVATSIKKGICSETLQPVSPVLKTRFEMANDMFSGFDVKVVPKDDHLLSTKVQPDDSALKRLSLPTHSYEEMIAKIRDEIRRSGALEKN